MWLARQWFGPTSGMCFSVVLNLCSWYCTITSLVNRLLLVLLLLKLIQSIAVTMNSLLNASEPKVSKNVSANVDCVMSLHTTGLKFLAQILLFLVSETSLHASWIFRVGGEWSFKWPQCPVKVCSLHKLELRSKVNLWLEQTTNCITVSYYFSSSKTLVVCIMCVNGILDCCVFSGVLNCRFNYKIFQVKCIL